MAIERLEVRFSPSNPEEQAIIAALEVQTEYGAKGRFLKARLIRGYVRMMREIESIKSESDPLAALNRVAESMDSGTYYALRALLYPAAAEPVPSGSAVAAPPAAVAPAVQFVEPVVEPVAVEVSGNASEGPVEAPEVTPAAMVEANLVDAAEAAPAPSMAIQRRPESEAPIARAEILHAASEPTATVVESTPAGGEPEPDVEVPAATPEAVAVEEVPAAPAPAMPNWGRFAGIAGTRGGN